MQKNSHDLQGEPENPFDSDKDKDNDNTYQSSHEEEKVQDKILQFDLEFDSRPYLQPFGCQVNNQEGIATPLISQHTTSVSTNGDNTLVTDIAKLDTERLTS